MDTAANTSRMTTWVRPHAPTGHNLHPKRGDSARSRGRRPSEGHIATCPEVGRLDHGTAPGKGRPERGHTSRCVARAVSIPALVARVIPEATNPDTKQKRPTLTRWRVPHAEWGTPPLAPLPQPRRWPIPEPPDLLKPLGNEAL